MKIFLILEGKKRTFFVSPQAKNKKHQTIIWIIEKTLKEKQLDEIEIQLVEGINFSYKKYEELKREGRRF